MQIKKRITRKRIIIAASCALAAPIIFAALYCGLTPRYYSVYSERMTSPVRIVLLSDLHSHIHGNNQEKLITIIKKQSPDLIVMTGDIADDVTPIDGTLLLLNGIRDVADIYYVTGNHEYWSSTYEETIEAIRSGVTNTRKQPVGEIQETIDAIEGSGVTILSDEYKEIELNSNKLVIAGVEDPARTNYYDPLYSQSSSMEQAFSNIGELDGYKILLAHRPERIAQYKRYDFDLVLSGHAHGGQARIPFILNGLFAPNQGFFPEYAGGVYEHGALTHIVSRGLVVSLFPPRIFNPPEVVVIDLLPEYNTRDFNRR